MKKNRNTFSAQQGKSSFKRTILDQVSGLQKEVVSIKGDIHKEAEKIIEKEMESRLTLVEFALREVRLLCDILVEKGIATQEEISAKREQIRKESE